MDSVVVASWVYNTFRYHSPVLLIEQPNSFFIWRLQRNLLAVQDSRETSYGQKPDDNRFKSFMLIIHF